MKRLVVPLLVVLIAGFLALPVLWTATREEPAEPVSPSTTAELTSRPRVDTTRRVRPATRDGTDEETEAPLESRISEAEVFFEPADVEIDWPRERITGRIVDEAGDGAGPATFEIRSTLGNWGELEEEVPPASLVSWGETDAEGRFEAEVLANRPVRMEATNRPAQLSDATTAFWTVVEQVEVVPADWTIVVSSRSVEVLVRDAEGRPVESAHVTLRPHAVRREELVANTTADGRAELPPGATGWVLAESPDGLSGAAAPLATGDVTFELTLSPLRRFTGTVVDDATGKPVAGVTIGAGRPTRVTTESDAAGGFELAFPHLQGRPPTRRLEVTADGYLPLRHFVTRGRSDERQEIRLRRGTQVQFRLVDAAGEPVPRARVVVEARSRIGYSTVGGRTAARSDADGNVRFTALAPDVPVAEVEVHVEGIRRHTRTIATGPAGTTSDLGTWVIGAEARIDGRVTTSDGTPAVGWVVAAAKRTDDSTPTLTDNLFEGGGMLSARTAEDGTFTLRGGSAGLWDVVAWTHDRPMATASAVSIGADGITLELRSPEPAPLVGRVVDAEDRPRADVKVSVLVDHPVALNLMATVRTDADGRFRYDGFGRTTDRVWVEFATSEPDENGAYTVAGLYLRPGEEALIRPDLLRAHDPDEHDRIRGR